MKSWADELVGVITGTGTQEQAPQCQLLLVDVKARISKIPGTGRFQMAAHKR